MFLLGVGCGLVGAFVVMVVAACAGTALVVRVDRRLPLPQFSSENLQALTNDEKVKRGLADGDRYAHALEAISTLGQDSTAQRIARQALGKGWVP